MENFIYRKAIKRDLNKILDLGYLIDDFESEEAKKFWDYDILLNCLNNEDSGLIVCAITDDNLAGFGVVLYNKIFKRAIISDLFVSPKYRNSGIGNELYELILKDAKEKNINSIQIITEYNNSSIIGFFENKGFDKINNNSLLFLNLE